MSSRTLGTEGPYWVTVPRWQYDDWMARLDRLERLEKARKAKEKK